MSDETQRAVVDTEMQALAAELEALLPDAHLAAQQNEKWLPTWFLRKHAELDAAKELVFEQYRKMLAQIDARKKALDYQWGAEFKAQVDADLAEQGGKKKSIDYLTGRAGYRTSGGRKTIVIEDETAAINAAYMACPDAIKRSLLKSVVQAYVEATGEELPGTRLETTPKVESFYPALTYMAITKEGDE